MIFREKYLHGLSQLEALGFRVREGLLTARATQEGYRSGKPQERAAELMALFEDPEVGCIITTIGGSNSSSLIPYLDFERIRRNPKIFCGYSDVTSLHLALLEHAGLRTFYGPAVVPSFGEWPNVLAETRDSFLAAVSGGHGERELIAPARWPCRRDVERVTSQRSHNYGLVGEGARPARYRAQVGRLKVGQGRRVRSSTHIEPM